MNFYLVAEHVLGVITAEKQIVFVFYYNFLTLKLFLMIFCTLVEKGICNPYCGRTFAPNQLVIKYKNSEKLHFPYFISCAGLLLAHIFTSG